MIAKCFNIVFSPLFKLCSFAKPAEEAPLKLESHNISALSRYEIVEKIARAQSKNNDLMLNRREAAEFLSVKTATLAMWKYTKRYPLPYIKVGSHVRYRASDLMNFLESNLNI